MTVHMKATLKASIALAIATCALASGNAQAAEVLTNGSFEAPSIGGGNYTYPGLPYGTVQGYPATLAGWTYAGSALVGATGGNAWYGGSAPAGQDGAQFAALQGTSTLSQVFSTTGGIATLSWLAAGRPSFGCCNGNQSYNVLLNSNLLGTFSTVNGQAFGLNTINLNTLAAGTYTLTFAGLATTDDTAFIDKVSLSAVPEPATWAMMLLGFGLVGAGLRSRRKQSVRVTYA